MDIREDLGDLATGSVGIRLQRQRECGLDTIASGVSAKQSPAFLCLLIQQRVCPQKAETEAHVCSNSYSTARGNVIKLLLHPSKG